MIIPKRAAGLEVCFVLVQKKHAWGTCQRGLSQVVSIRNSTKSCSFYWKKSAIVVMCWWIVRQMDPNGPKCCMVSIQKLSLYIHHLKLVCHFMTQKSTTGTPDTKSQALLLLKSPCAVGLQSYFACLNSRIVVKKNLKSRAVDWINTSVCLDSSCVSTFGPVKSPVFLGEIRSFLAVFNNVPTICGGNYAWNPDVWSIFSG